ncbi:MAG: trypsin-like peptidase domain-containing protein, partial [Actinomycetes bacterium]
MLGLGLAAGAAVGLLAGSPWVALTGAAMAVFPGPSDYRLLAVARTGKLAGKFVNIGDPAVIGAVDETQRELDRQRKIRQEPASPASPTGAWTNIGMWFAVAQRFNTELARTLADRGLDPVTVVYFFDPKRQRVIADAERQLRAAARALGHPLGADSSARWIVGGAALIGAVLLARGLDPYVGLAAMGAAWWPGQGASTSPSAHETARGGSTSFIRLEDGHGRSPLQDPRLGEQTHPAADSVVLVQRTRRDGFFGRRLRTGYGTGVVVRSEDGFVDVLTNRHVVRGAIRFTVRLGDREWAAEPVKEPSKRELIAALTRIDPRAGQLPRRALRAAIRDTDLAVLRLDTRGGRDAITF